MSTRTSHRARAPQRAAISKHLGITGLSRDPLYSQMRQGNRDYTKASRRRLITRHHLDRFLDIGTGRPGNTKSSSRRTGADAP